MKATAEDPIVVVNIVSVSYSGSTWVNLLLGSHSEAFSVGEIKSILKVGKAVCTLHGEDCPVWGRYNHQADDNPFLQIAQLTGQRCLIVNNSRKFLRYQGDPRIRSKFVHLVRDGRAVTASMLRKKTEPSMWRAARMWSHDVRRNQRLIRRQDRDESTLLIYEKIKADTEGELRSLCEFIGIQYQPEMLSFWEAEHHFLGGNRGTLLSLAKRSQAELPQAPSRQFAQGQGPDWDMDYYKQADPARFVDERWKRELTDSQLRVFALVAGGVNRRYGYPRSLKRN